MYGIIGYPLLQTFSPGYFNKKFEALGISASYHKFPLAHIQELKALLIQHPELKGLNVTIPYKQEVMIFLDQLDDAAEKIGAVNTIAIRSGQLKGYNTDAIGFMNSLKPLLQPHHTKALILGTGGASKAVAYTLAKLEIDFQYVSRNKKEGQLSYKDMDEQLMQEHTLIINTTPLGMVPRENEYPDIPYQLLTPHHLLYDLIYFPEETIFLQKGKEQGAQIKNGYEMLIGQAEAAWAIWQKD
jgi:shikimate dehydrogenase